VILALAGVAAGMAARGGSDRGGDEPARGHHGPRGRSDRDQQRPADARPAAVREI